MIDNNNEILLIGEAGSGKTSLGNFLFQKKLSLYLTNVFLYLWNTKGFCIWFNSC